MIVPGMDFPQHPQMMTGEFEIMGRGSGSSNEGVSSAMIGMGGFKKEKLDPGYGDTVESEWACCEGGILYTYVLIYCTGKTTKLSGYVHVF